MCEITINRDKIRIIIDEILRIVPLHITYFIYLIIYEFATNRNLTCAELMRKAYQLGRPWWNAKRNFYVIDR